MKKIKKFEDFINESNFYDNDVSKRFGSILTPNYIDYTDYTDYNQPDEEITSGESNYSPLIVSSSIPGNDDFALYMQHQQGLGGATGIIKALNGTGEMHPETIKTKKGVKYANLVMNIPSDRPEVKKDLINALDNGDQKTAASLFLNMWKDKWFGRQKYAVKAINDPKNSEVKDAITKACIKYNIPFDFAVTVAMIESSLNPLSQGNTYKGLFAMVPSSDYEGSVTPIRDNWKDPYINSEAGIGLLAANIKKFKKSLGNDWASISVGKWADNLARGIVSTNTTQSFRDPSTPAGKSIVIGDSYTPYVAAGAGIAEGPKAAKIDNPGNNGLWYGGIAVGRLLEFANAYKGVDGSVKNVVISMGTNGIYGRSTGIVTKLVARLHTIFPNAKLLVVKGSYGDKLKDYPKLQTVKQSTVDAYYSDFATNGVTVIPTPVGNVKDGHGPLPIYKVIGKEIKERLKE